MSRLRIKEVGTRRKKTYQHHKKLSLVKRKRKKTIEEVGSEHICGDPNLYLKDMYYMSDQSADFSWLDVEKCKDDIEKFNDRKRKNKLEEEALNQNLESQVELKQEYIPKPDDLEEAKSQKSLIKQDLQNLSNSSKLLNSQDQENKQENLEDLLDFEPKNELKVDLEMNIKAEDEIDEQILKQFHEEKHKKEEDKDVIMEDVENVNLEPEDDLDLPNIYDYDPLYGQQYINKPVNIIQPVKPKEDDLDPDNNDEVGL